MQKTKEQITKLSIFDFDGTLVATPLPTHGPSTYEKITGNVWPHKGWWSKPETLDTSIFDMPVIDSVMQTYREESNDPNTLMVMLTGRMSRLSNQVEKVLSEKNLVFDKYLYNIGGDTLYCKIKHMNSLLAEYENVNSILLNDDRLEHIPEFELWCDNLVKTGRIKTFKINVVPSDRHE